MDVGEVVKSEAAPDRRFEDRLRKAQLVKNARCLSQLAHLASILAHLAGMPWDGCRLGPRRWDRRAAPCHAFLFTSVAETGCSSGGASGKFTVRSWGQPSLHHESPRSRSASSAAGCRNAYLNGHVAGVTGFSSVTGRKTRPALSGLFVGIQECQRESSPGVG
jgi:hypothetical protein